MPCSGSRPSGGTVVGMDLLSRASAYVRLHEKLLGSYTMEALIRRGKASTVRKTRLRPLSRRSRAVESQNINRLAWERTTGIRTARSVALPSFTRGR